jgi:hypothetical protein
MSIYGNNNEDGGDGRTCMEGVESRVICPYMVIITIPLQLMITLSKGVESRVICPYMVIMVRVWVEAMAGPVMGRVHSAITVR